MDSKIAKILDYQARQITYNVYTYYKTRKQDKNSKEYLQDTNLIGLVADVTGLSKSSVTRIIREGNAMKQADGVVDFSTKADKVKHVRKKRIELDENTEGIIRRKVIQFYTVMNEVPSVRKLNILLEKENILRCSVEYLRQLLHKLGFTNGEENEAGIMMERPDIALDRLQYLQRMRIFRQNNCNIFFFSETVFWNLNNSPNEVAKANSMPSIIIVHMSGPTGCLDQKNLKMKAKAKNSQSIAEDHDSDYNWVRESFLPNIPAKSVIVMDGPPCEVETAGDIAPPIYSYATRMSMQDWLKNNKIPFKETDTKEDLAHIIKHVLARKQLTFSSVLVESGHSVTYLPPKHTDLNPTRVAWDNIRSTAKKSNRNSAMSLFARYPADKWRACFDKVKATEDEYYENDMKMDEAVDSLKMAIKEEKEKPDEDEVTVVPLEHEHINGAENECMECDE